MKKTLCLLVTIVMLMQCASFVYAEETTPTYTGEVEPYLDMEVKLNGAAGFENGPLSLSASSAVVDYKTTLDMEEVKADFEKWYDRAIKKIKLWASTDADPVTKEASLTTAFESTEITGEFTVTITYPGVFQVPDAFITGGDMYGFNDEAKTIFKEESRTPGVDGDNKTLAIKISVKGPGSTGNKLTVKELYDNRESYLADLSLTAEAVNIPQYGTYTVRGTMSGKIESANTISGNAISLRVDYTGKQDPAAEKVNTAEGESGNVSATVTLVKTGGGGGRASGSITFNVDGNTTLVNALYGNRTVKLEELPVPTKPGYVFDGWYYDVERTQKVEESIKVNNRKIILYGHFESEVLVSEDHFAYVIGYPDGTVKPLNNITREEVATIFYRLLREDKLVSIAATTNNFTDVEDDRWSNKAISTLANGGYINGYEDGTFAPSKFITRAEFAAMATRYAELSKNENVSFSDIGDHWAEEYILKASSVGWVTGYEDGTFAPEKYITRAEVMTIINRMLTRYVDSEGIHADTKLWSDMDGSEWYYYNVLEATNAHNYERREDGVLEKWTEITPNKVWLELDEMENAE